MAAKAAEAQGADSKLDNMLYFMAAEARSRCDTLRAQASADAKKLETRLRTAGILAANDAVKAEEGELRNAYFVSSSQQVSEARLAVLEARDREVKRLLGEVAEKAAARCSESEDRYLAFLVRMCEAGCDALGVKEVRIEVRPRDASAVGARLQEELQRKGIAAELASVLPDSCAGGVVVSTPDGKIRADCTVESRVRQAFEQNEPVISARLLPEISSLWN